MAEKLLKEHLYGDLLSPETGYKTDFAVGMTYSLGFDAMLTAYLAFGMLDDVDDDALSTPHLLLKAISESSDKVIVFCNKGGIAVPATIQKAHSLLERNIYEVFDRKNIHANFHPKLWLIREVSKDESGHALIKLIVTSRNLKFTETIDCIACLTGKVRTDVNEKHRPLADFVMDVAEGSGTTQHKAIKSLVNDLMKVDRFDVSEPFVDYEFLPYFFYKTLKEQKPNDPKANKAIIVSPFITDETLKELLPKNIKERVLITRREHVNQEILDMFDGNVYVCNDELVAQGMDLHAKMYYMESGRNERYMFLGSANATDSAFNRNAEFLLKLKYNGQNGHRKKFLSELFSENEEDNKFVQVRCDDLNAKDADASTEEADRTIEKLMKELMCKDSLKAHITHHQSGDYSITVTTDKYDKTDSRIFLAPLQKEGSAMTWSKKMEFTDLKAADLSEFFIISGIEENGRHLKKIIKIPTTGIPTQERDRAIYKSIVRKNDFYAFIGMMLTDYPLSYIAGIKTKKETENGTAEPVDKTEYYGLYESLLRTAASEPDKIKKIKRVTDNLDKDVVPEEFRKLIRHFAAAIN